MQNSKSTKSSRGFTLIELLVVIAIIGLLTSFLVANFIGVKQRARDAQRKSDLTNIQAALEFYRSDQASYPTTLPSCGSSLKDPDNNTTYMQKVPCDPLSPTSPFTYKYIFSAVDGTYKLVACLENANDTQKDSTNDAKCIGESVSFTLENP